MSISSHPLNDPVTMSAEYLLRAGLRVLDSKWKCDLGELAVVAADRQVLIACEVTASTSGRHHAALPPLPRTRIGRMRRLAIRWMHEHGVRYDQVRIDVIQLAYEGTGGYTIEHTRAVG